MHKPFKILLADDHSVVRQGMSLVLKEAFDNAAVYQARDFESALLILKQETFDLLLLDINLPGGNTVNMIDQVKAVSGAVKILMFSAYDEEQYALRYLRAGANGYLNKLSTEQEIVNAVRSVIEKGEYISDKIREVAANNHHNPLETLSDRELQIAELLVKGEGNLEISNLLNIQMSTVSTYKKRIFDKLTINNIPGLIEVFKLYHEA
jgi:DNA-binding NarL/FixJ family response regulator